MFKEPIMTVEQKLSIVLEELIESTNIAELCRRHSISHTSLFKWGGKFLQGGKSSPASNGSGTTATEAGKAKVAVWRE